MMMRIEEEYREWCKGGRGDCWSVGVDRWPRVGARSRRFLKEEEQGQFLYWFCAILKECKLYMNN